MELTKFTHACVRIADAEHRLVIDPGVFSEVEQALDGVDAVLITHEHADHVDAPRLAAAAAANGALRIWAPQALADQLRAHEPLAGRVTAVAPGEAFDAGGLAVRTFGGLHAQIHPSLPWVSNVGYLVADAVYHPGDSYWVPPATVPALLIPINAPWAKVSETLDFLVSVRAGRAFPIHNGLLNEAGHGGYEGHLHRVSRLYGTTTFEHLDAGQSVVL